MKICQKSTQNLDAAEFNSNDIFMLKTIMENLIKKLY